MAMENASENRAVLRLELQIKRHPALNAGLFRLIPGRKPRMSFRGNGVAAVCWPPPDGRGGGESDFCRRVSAGLFVCLSFARFAVLLAAHSKLALCNAKLLFRVAQLRLQRFCGFCLTLERLTRLAQLRAAGLVARFAFLQAHFRGGTALL